MSKRYLGGLISRTPRVPTRSSAPGVWTLDQAIAYSRAGTWPIGVTILASGWIGLFAPGYSTTNDIAIDSSGNVYFGGSISGQSVISKFSNTGNVLWQRNLNTSGILSIGVDSSANVYLGGHSGSPKGFQIFKYNTSGNLLWQRNLPGTTFDNLAYGIAVDSSGNSYIAGFANPIDTRTTFQIVKYDTSGNLLWQRSLGPSGQSVTGSCIAVDSSGNSYIGGLGGINDIIIAKYNTLGTLQWQRIFGSGASGYEQCSSIEVDSSGNVYVCGDTYNISSGHYELIIAKYDTLGTLQWQRSLDSGSNSTTEVGNGVVVDSSGNVYVCGYTSFNYGFIIAKYDTLGNIQWQRILTDTGISTEFGFGIAADSSNVYVCGYSTVSGTYDFLLAKLPNNGSATGTYTVGAYSFVYDALAFSNTATSFSNTATSFSNTATSFSNTATSFSNTVSNLTFTVAQF
jgi:outer membrane protein assembly factor BamB